MTQQELEELATGEALSIADSSRLEGLVLDQERIRAKLLAGYRTIQAQRILADTPTHRRRSCTNLRKTSRNTRKENETRPHRNTCQTPPPGRRAGFDITEEKPMTILKPKFELGDIVATDAVIRLAATHGLTLYPYLRKHHCGEWGDEDKAANDLALENGGRILSSYYIADQKIHILTRASRSMTAVMLAAEY